MTAPQTRSSISGEWIKLGRTFCSRQANDGDLPQWQRIAFYCYANMKPGGRCDLRRNELAEAFGVSKTNLYRNLNKAKEKGWLHHTSSMECLVAPPYDVEFTRGKRAVAMSA